MDFNTATAFCQSRGTYIATVEDLEAAYRHGYERCGCGWAANGISYIVMQEASTKCHSSIGISQCSWESNRGVFCRRPTPVFLSKDPRGNYNMTLAEARQHCHGKGTTLATYEDLVHAYHLGYETCSCGWADNGLTYTITQTPNHACMYSIGVAKCSMPMICNAFCRSSPYESEPYSLSSSAETSFAFPDRHFATALQKVIYYRTNYNMDYNEARAYCESRGTFIATFQDLMAAYHHGYERSSCGWAANGISYLVIQQAIDGYTSSGVVKCSLESNQGVYCRRPTPVIYYSTNYNMDFNTATAFCQSKGTYIATVEDLETAYHHGYERCGCGWAANGISYIVMQEANTNCHSSIGISQCSWESNRGVFCRRPTPVFLSKDPRGDYAMTLAEARQHCHGKGTTLATYEDLVHAYHLGYETCSCGWADNGLTYTITQTPNHACGTSVGVVKCSTPMICNAFCRSSEFETENYPLSSSAETSSALSGRQFTIASQKVIYYPTNYNMEYNEARAYCESRGTFIATFQDLMAAYHHGYERSSCGWAANGISYLVIQQAIDGYTSSGVVKCSLESNQGVYCRRPTPGIFKSTHH
ncbi:hypothetical protein ACJMK2_016650 [Sinanodonta woodiana]|uniref:Link domain-containing protein n=1 Tax=Sinanodonta woodiana TaxID=1069815 RepID=A0ABD3UUF1_SINWO